MTSSCRKAPAYVINPEKMAELMADIHIAETVVESNRMNYPSDSSKMLLKQSVLNHHGLSQQDMDTSLMWYAANLDIYDGVYDRTIEILEQRLSDAGISSESIMSAAGDSINIWSTTPFMIVKSSSPSQYLTFRFENDDSWSLGDMFTLRGKFHNVSGMPSWSITSDYDDGAFEILTNRFSGEGWHEITFYTDSTKLANSIYGSINFDVVKGVMVVDSLQLIRKPLIPQIYSQRYRQRSYKFEQTDEGLGTDNEISE